MSLCRLEDPVIGLVLFDVGGVLIDLSSKDKEIEAVLERESTAWTQRAMSESRSRQWSEP